MKSTTLTVAAAAMVIFVQSAQAREHHHDHRHHHSLMASRGIFVGERQHQTDCSLLRPPTSRRARSCIGGAIKRVRLPGAAGRCVASSASIRVRHSTWRATGRIGAGRDRPELARWWYGRTMSARSSVSKTENGSSNPATTAMRFAPALARSRARLRSGGVDCPSSSPFLESKRPPGYRAAQFSKNAVRAIRLLPSAARPSGNL